MTEDSDTEPEGGGQNSPKGTTILCDEYGCREQIKRPDSVSETWKKAKEKGWSKMQSGDYCPKHTVR